MKVTIFLPCYIDQFNPEVGVKMVKFFEKYKVDIHWSKKVFCCGQPAFNSGFHNEAKKVVELFLKEFADSDYIIIPSSSCAGFLKNYAQELIADKNEKINPNIIDVLNKVYEFSEFVATIFLNENLNLSFPHKVAYHTSCATLRECNTHKYTLEILKKIQGLELVPFNYADTCCGFGGSFAETYIDISVSMAKQKLENIKASGVQYIISNDSSCLLHLKGVAEKLNYNFSFLNIVELFSHI